MEKIREGERRIHELCKLMLPPSLDFFKDLQWRMRGMEKEKREKCAMEVWE